MLAGFRLILMALALGVISLVSCTMCLLRPFHRNNVHHTAVWLGKLSVLAGIKVEIRFPENHDDQKPVVFICNHQNTFDVITLSGAVLPGCVSVGKKSLKWIPFFGWMYWLTGNIMIDRKNKNKAHGTIANTAEKIKSQKLSPWLFPEGTRSRGRGLLPFKTGAFRTAQQAGVAIVPICASNLCGNIDLNRWNNGKMIIEYMDPIEVKDLDKKGLRDIADSTHALMLDKITQLDKELAAEQG